MSTYKEITIPAIFQNRARQHGSRACVAYKNPDGIYEDISWTRMNEMVTNLAYYLIDQGIQPGDKVALFSQNSYQWVICDQAILAVGAVNVPIYATNSAQEARYVIENSDSVLCFTGQNEHLNKIVSVKDGLPNLKGIVAIEGNSSADVVTFDEALRAGAAKAEPNKLDQRIKAINPSDMATIIYTSGTTGNPKGVMLSHYNFTSNVKQIYAVAPELFDAKSHTLLSFLPLSHSLERTAGYYMPIYCSKTQVHKIAFAEDPATVLENLNDVRPTFIISVPRLYEKIHSGISSKVGNAPRLKQIMFGWSQSVARRYLPYICNDRQPSGLFALEHKLANKLVFAKLREALGMDQLEFAVSGGGPLTQSDAEFFLGMGIKVMEGFGLTETTPVTNVNRPGFIKPGTVGPPLMDTITRIGDEGELQIKGPQVMLGYYKNEEATKEVFTADGYFRTGDIGEIDNDGFLKITGRLKDLIVTSGGKNISPQNLENSLKASLFIEQIAIIGDNRKYLSALVVPSFDELKIWADNNQISYSNTDDLLANDKVIELFDQEIQKHTADFARVEQIRKFRLLKDEWSQETEELTPTMKLKRRVITQKYSQEIEGMYNV